VLVTGASGYVGRRVCAAAAEWGIEAVAAAWRHPERVGGVRAVVVDVTDRAAVDRVVTAKRPDAVLHLAAVNPGGDETVMHAVNAGGAAA
jgi:UDP-glucose 4-epimerase